MGDLDQMLLEAAKETRQATKTWAPPLTTKTPTRAPRGWLVFATAFGAVLVGVGALALLGDRDQEVTTTSLTGSLPPPSAASESAVPMTSYRDGAGYEVLLPSEWVSLTRLYAPGITRFGFGRGAATRGYPALQITIGRPDGSILICPPYDDQYPALDGCTEATVTTVEELGEALESRDPSSSILPACTTNRPCAVGGVYEYSGGRVLLGGEESHYEAGRSHNGLCLGCPGYLYQIYTIHEGTPVVLTFDWWTIQFGDEPTDPGNPAAVRDIVASFRWLTESELPSCSATGVSLGTEPYEWRSVSSTVTEIVNAATFCDIDRLIELAGEDFTTSFGGGGAEMFAEWETQGEGKLGILLRLFATDSAVQTFEEDAAEALGSRLLYVWPAAFARDSWDEITDEEMADLLTIYTQEELDQMAGFGSYAGWRIGITYEGDWVFFVAGD